MINFELNFEQFLRDSGLTENNKTMRKKYIKPSMEAIKIKMGQQLLAGSVTGIGGNGNLDPTPGPGDGTGGSIPHAPGLFDGDEWDALLGE